MSVHCLYLTETYQNHITKCDVSDALSNDIRVAYTKYCLCRVKAGDPNYPTLPYISQLIHFLMLIIRDRMENALKW